MCQLTVFRLRFRFSSPDHPSSMQDEHWAIHKHFKGAKSP